MIKHIIQQVAEKSPCQFQQLESPFEDLDFYEAKDSRFQRFLVILEVNQLCSPSELNAQVQNKTPESLLTKPSFAKNTDLVILFKLDELTDLPQQEHSIFDIEENAYSLKKHVLYYTTKELDQLKQYFDRGEDIDSLISSSEAFTDYKENPNEETAFSLTCRLFVKLPFLAAPIQESTLEDANKIADQLLSEKQLLTFFQSIELQIAKGSEYKKVMEALIDEQMAN